MQRLAICCYNCNAESLEDFATCVKGENWAFFSSLHVGLQANDDRDHVVQVHNKILGATWEAKEQKQTPRTYSAYN